MLTFRKATPEDKYFIARGFHMAMLMTDTPEERIIEFADTICWRDDVLYSWRNTIIAQWNGTDAGMITSYDGRYYKEWQTKTFSIVREKLEIEFPGMEDEAQPGEYYIDSLAVLEEYRGKGIGTSLLQKAIDVGKTQNLKVTIAVDPININAQKLYESLGFKRAGDLFIFGHTYWKMTI